MIKDLNLNQRILTIISATIFLILVLTCLYVFWQWYQDWALTHATQTEVPTIIATNDKNPNVISAISERHLFGQSYSQGAVPISNLQFRLTGIVKLEQEGSGIYSKAFISIAGQAGKIFRVGENLPYGVKLYEITPTAVILQNDGHLEKLPLLREKLKFKPSSLRN